MQYCRYHDMAFYQQHKGECFLNDCYLEEEPNAVFCSVCAGLLKPRSERSSPQPLQKDERNATSGKAASEQQAGSQTPL